MGFLCKYEEMDNLKSRFFDLVWFFLKIKTSSLRVPLFSSNRELITYKIRLDSLFGRRWKLFVLEVEKSLL